MLAKSAKKRCWHREPRGDVTAMRSEAKKLFLSLVTEMADHARYLACQTDDEFFQIIMILRCKEADFLCYCDMSFQFIERASCIMEKMSKILSGAAAFAFCNV